MHRLSRTWLVKVTLLVTIGRGLVATAEGAVKTGAFTDDACAFTKSRCAVSNKKRGGVLFRMSLAPPRNHVAQCPKNRTTSLILPMTLAPSLSHVAQCPKKRRGVLFWMSLAPPRNHVAQCPKKRTTLKSGLSRVPSRQALDFCETQYKKSCACS